MYRAYEPFGYQTRQKDKKRTSDCGNAQWLYYESLKRQLTKQAATSSGYEAACRLAARLAGV